jgi:hypothetical protein
MGSKVHYNKNPYDRYARSADLELFKQNNPNAMTVSQQRHQYNKHLANRNEWNDGTLETLYKGSYFKGGVPYKYLINDTGEDLPGLRTYKSLGMDERPLSDQFGGVHDLNKIKATLASLFPDNPLYAAEALKEVVDGTITTTPPDGSDGNNGDTQTPPSYLTQDDLSSWWEGVDKSAWTQQETKPKPMDNFLKMMMFMAMMRPQGGRGGGGGMGLSNIAQLVSAFGLMNGSGSSNNTNTTTTT